MNENKIEKPKEAKVRINKIIDSIPNETEEDRNKIYSYVSIRDKNKLIEINSEDNLDKLGYNVRFCKKCNRFNVHQKKNCLVCRSKKSGLGNPKIHQRTIDTQIKNGTHNFLSKDFKKKSMQTRIENIGYKEFCNYMSTISKNAWKDENYKQKQHDNLVNRWKDEEQAQKMMSGIVKFRNNPNSKEILSNNTKKQWENKEYRNFMNEVLKNNRDSGLCGYHIEYCEKCETMTLHNGKWCSICYPDKCVIKTRIIKFNPNCDKHPDCEFIYLDENINNCNSDDNNNVNSNSTNIKFICFECFKENFENNKIIPKDIEEFKNKIKQDYPYHDVFIQSTYRTQESTDWSGSKQVFEKDLTDKKIGWFAYIKFYRKTNDKTYVKPIVSGKSGSKEVNSQGSDVNFSENVEDGPARRLLSESNGKYVWDKTKILVIPCKSEEEAFRIEKEIQDKYGLFGS